MIVSQMQKKAYKILDRQCGVGERKNNTILGSEDLHMRPLPAPATLVTPVNDLSSWRLSYLQKWS